VKIIGIINTTISGVKSFSLVEKNNGCGKTIIDVGVPLIGSVKQSCGG